MKKLLAIFLTFSSATTLYTMERDDQSLVTFAYGWQITHISQEKPASGECLKTIFASPELIEADNTDPVTKNKYPAVLNMGLCLPDQIRQNRVDIRAITRCEFLSQYRKVVLPNDEKTYYLTLENKDQKQMILEIDHATNPSILIDIPDPDDSDEPGVVKHNMDKSPIAQIMRPKFQTQGANPTPQQPKKEVPSAVIKPYSVTTKFIGEFLSPLRLPFAAFVVLFGWYKMGYLPDNVSQFLDDISAKFFAFSR